MIWAQSKQFAPVQNNLDSPKYFGPMEVTLSYPLTKIMNRVPKDRKVVIIKVILQWNLSENDFLSKISYLENNL